MDVFISYNSEDRVVAEEICTALKGRGISCWIDYENDLFGANYADTIVKEIAAAPVFLVLLSERSMQSQHVLRELTLAADKGKTVIPVALGDITLPPAFDYYLSAKHCITYSADLPQKLIGRICTLLQPESPAVDPMQGTHIYGKDYRQTQKHSALWIKIAALVAVVLLLVVCAFLIGKIAAADTPGKETPGITTHAQQTDTTPGQTSAAATTEQTKPTTQPETTAPETTAAVAGEDQTAGFYDDAIAAFEGQSEQRKSLSTLKIRVGEGQTPMAASVWTGCEIQSKDTSIAVADGAVVKGVAPGETYVVIVASTGMSSVYKVIVK